MQIPTLIVAMLVTGQALACPATIDRMSGPASWYGPRHHGKPTASGLLFDQHALTAAHPYLPFGTKIVVTARKTGAQATVTITDRGPFIAGRILDLSEAAAETLGIKRAGIACVDLAFFRAPPPVRPQPRQPDGPEPSPAYRAAGLP
ncbi:septal ring lytic transglycosylase RlpA family protein [Lacibacterium aquatile]|uniref:Endolytic peptidoglycan transglycosylase RlpA n=1 Tax=Lacibacterium aquatile TaxID=1168082 RepID=A0ABW5DRN3_9PROT